MLGGDEIVIHHLLLSIFLSRVLIHYDGSIGWRVFSGIFDVVYAWASNVVAWVKFLCVFLGYGRSFRGCFSSDLIAA
jgi:hypothetical protein